MNCKDLIVDGLNRVDGDVRHTLDGLTAEQLAFRPAKDANSIAWLAWHLARQEDGQIADMAGSQQVWIEGRWHERFGKPADPQDSGFGYTREQVAEISPEGPRVLVDYYAAVHARSLAYLEALTCQEMDRIIDRHWDPPVTVGVRLVSIVNDATQHVGQMAYLRGIIEDRRWLPY